MRTYSTAELWGRLANDDKAIAREAQRSLVLACMRANTRVLWGNELIAVGCTAAAYNLGLSAGARLVDGVYAQNDDVGAMQVVGEGAEIDSLLPSGKAAAVLTEEYTYLSGALVAHAGGLAFCCTSGLAPISYSQIRSALLNGDVGWDRFSGLVLGRALFGVVRRATITVAGPFVTGEVFTVVDADADTVLTYTVLDGDDAENVVAGLKASMDDARFVFEDVEAGVFSLTDTLAETGAEENADGLVASTDSAGGSIGAVMSDAVSTLVWTYESERQNASIQDPEPVLFGTPEPAPEE